MNILNLAFPRHAQRSLLYTQFRSDVGKALNQLEQHGVPSCPLTSRDNPVVEVLGNKGLLFEFPQEESFQESTSSLKFYLINRLLFEFPPKRWLKNLSYYLSQTGEGGLVSDSPLAAVQQTPSGTALFETARNSSNPSKNWGTEVLSRRPFQDLFEKAANNWRARFISCS